VNADGRESAGPAPDAIVLLANYLQAPGGWGVEFGWVGSRMLLWCLSGRGQVTVNGVRRGLEAGRFLFLPWGHAIRYVTDDYQPFLLGGIHVIPDHDRDVPPEYRIVHSDRDLSAERPERRDAKLPGLDDVLVGRLDDVPGLEGLTDYVVKWFVGRRREESAARALGRVIISEMIGAAGGREAGAVMLPARLRRVMEHVRRNIARPLTVEGLAAVADCSPATLSRCFRKHLRVTPIGWVIRRRVEKARELLVSTRLPVGEVGARVGVDDPYYFSKLFRKSTGFTASEYRLRNSLV
jgi:AraC-like DNA-binding protein